MNGCLSSLGTFYVRGKKQYRVEAKVKLAFALCSVCDREAFGPSGFLNADY
jgi:hypothetical protein